MSKREIKNTLSSWSRGIFFHPSSSSPPPPPPPTPPSGIRSSKATLCETEPRLECLEGLEINAPVLIILVETPGLKFRPTHTLVMILIIHCSSCWVTLKKHKKRCDLVLLILTTFPLILFSLESFFYFRLDDNIYKVLLCVSLCGLLRE